MERFLIFICLYMYASVCVPPKFVKSGEVLVNRDSINLMYASLGERITFFF